MESNVTLEKSPDTRQSRTAKMLHCMHNQASSFKIQPIDASCILETKFAEFENR